jgi:Skp family chaperone for outer membrane proteins
VVAAVAEKRALHLVLNEDTGIVVWGVPELDITSEVVAELGAR